VNIGRPAVVQLPGHTNQPGLANTTDDASAYPGEKPMSLTMREKQPERCGSVAVRLAEPDDYPAIRAVILAAYGDDESAIGPGYA
jgi:hypothetical protein